MERQSQQNLQRLIVFDLTSYIPTPKNSRNNINTTNKTMGPESGKFL